jgi:branched-subunit amino acid ABC-type transport system permease component
LSLFLSSVVFGVISASVLALGAAGFTLQYSISNIFNLAFTEVMSTSAFVAYLANRAGLNIWLCLLVAAATGGAVSVLLNRVIYQPYQRRGAKPYTMVIVTMAVGLIMQNIVLGIGGSSFFNYRFSSTRAFTIGQVQISWPEIWIIVIAAVGMLAVHALLKYSRVGKAMRATAADPSLAAACGIRSNRVIDVAWLVSGGLCGIAGVTLFINTFTFSSSTASGFLIVIVAASILGGIGDAYGAMIGALVIGLATEISAIWINPAYKTGVAFILLFIVLLTRPSGIRSTVSALAGVRS